MMSEAIQEPNVVDDFDIESLLQRFSDDPILDFDIDLDLDLDLLRESWVPESDLPPNVFQSSDSSSPVPPTSADPPTLEAGSPDSISSFVNYIENFLMEDVDWGDGGKGAGEDGVANFFSGVLCDDSINSKIDVDSPESYDASTKVGQSKEEEVPEVFVVEDDDDSVSKKRRRQMRNRESAMISRERKKMYIKNLEMKNKHFEIEYRRLENTLQCCMAENMVLRQSLQFRKNRSCSASVAKQESAVLFMESLLLGSLFWFVSLVSLFLPPSLRSLRPNLKVLSWSERGLAVVLARTKSRNILTLGNNLKLILLRLRRRCRSMRARMKFFLFPLHAVLA